MFSSVLLIKSIALSPAYEIISEDAIYENNDDVLDSILLQNKILCTTDLDSQILNCYDRLEYDRPTETITFRRDKKKNGATTVVDEQSKQNKPLGVSKYQITKTYIHVNTKCHTDLMVFFYPFVFWHDMFGESDVIYSFLVTNISPDNYIVEVVGKKLKFNIKRLLRFDSSKVYETTTCSMKK